VHENPPPNREPGAPHARGDPKSTQLMESDDAVLRAGERRYNTINVVAHWRIKALGCDTH